MNLNAHYGLANKLAGTHSFLSPSSPAWINYEEDKLDRVYWSNQEARRGTQLHDFANQAILLKVKLPDTKATLNQYVNDAIGFGMIPEQLLYYSDNCYGHADAVGFRNKTLRVHDLKTGKTPASMTQLKIYAALFCLEYKFTPFEIKIELRIYQNDDVVLELADPDEIFHIMEKIKFFDKRINYLRSEDVS